MLRVKSLYSLVIIFVLKLSVKLADGATLYKAPSDINVFVGESFNLTCGITDVKSSESRSWVRVNDLSLSFVSLEDRTFTPFRNYEVSLTPDYTVIVTDATSSLSGVYRCGVAISTGKTTYSLNKLATITVSVLESGRTTPTPTTIQPIQATSLTTEISQPAMSEKTTEQTTTSMAERPRSTTPQPAMYVEITEQTTESMAERPLTTLLQTSKNFQPTQEPNAAENIVILSTTHDERPINTFEELDHTLTEFPMETIMITNDTHMIETTPSSELLGHNGKGDFTVGLVFISCITFLGIYVAY